MNLMTRAPAASVFARLSDEDPDQPEPSSEHGEDGIDREVTEAVLVARHGEAFHVVVKRRPLRFATDGSEAELIPQ